MVLVPQVPRFKRHSLSFGLRHARSYLKMSLVSGEKKTKNLEEIATLLLQRVHFCSR